VNQFMGFSAMAQPRCSRECGAEHRRASTGSADQHLQLDQVGRLMVVR
jgi:hypothetical protein